MASQDTIKRIIDSKCPPANYGVCGPLVSRDRDLGLSMLLNE